MNKKNWISFDTDKTCITFSKDFKFEKNVKDAKISITSIGWFHLYINEKQVDTSAFTPGWTDLSKRIQYYVYDIKDFIFGNSFSLKVDIGEGWGASKTFMRAFRNKDGFTYAPISLNYKIEISFDDGSKEVLTSDDTLDVYSNHIVDTSVYMGESQDINIKPEFLGKSKFIINNADLIPQEGEDIIFGERIVAKKIFKDNEGNTIVDFGQNFAGIVEVNIDANDGETLSYTPFEVLDNKGNFYNKNYRAAKSFYSFKLSNKVRIYKPEFSFLGGRYLKLFEFPENIKAENFTAVLVHSGMQKTCFYECSNAKIQRLYLNTIYGQLSNYIDVPTDCPQRDERAGWTADAQVFCSTGAIHYNVKKFFDKWLKDLVLEQKDDGGIMGVCPLVNDQYDIIGSGWGDACCIIPFEMYKAYGDKNVLKDNLQMMENWVKYLQAHFKKEHIVQLSNNWGDWLALDKFQDGEMQGLTRYDLVSTAFYARCVEIIIFARKELNMPTDEFDRLLTNIKKAYNDEFIEDKHMIGEPAHLFSKMDRTCYTQTGIILSVYFDLVDKETKDVLIKDLVKLIHECGDKMTTGFLGTPYILQTLSENGYNDLAYTLLLQEEYPSWLYSVNKGATTMWEHYDGIKEDGTFWFESMNSFNHYAYGAVFSWIFNYSTGIKPIAPNYSKVLIKPMPNEKLGKTTCTYKSSYGDIVVNWECLGNKKAKYHIEVPSGIEATIDLGEFKTITSIGGTFDKELSY